MCDVDLDGTFSAADTPLAGIEVDITSQDVPPGQLFTGTTDGTGSYNVPLPARVLGCFCTDRENSAKHITLECLAP